MLASGLSREGLILNSCVLQAVAGIILSDSRWRQRPDEFCLVRNSRAVRPSHLMPFNKRQEESGIREPECLNIFSALTD